MSATWPRDDHVYRFFADCVLGGFAAEHAAEVTRLCAMPAGAIDADELAISERLLRARFTAKLQVFERKRYVNLTHEANKAMNLNACIGRLGGRYREVESDDGCHLVRVRDDEPCDVELPAARYLVTLDADSVILAGYVRRLAAIMQQPGKERVAVVQTPYAAFPGARCELERIASATTDVQLLLHHGFTHFSATFWVGANAMLRKEALEAIREDDQERGFPIARYIQDRTVIEDTESTIDLVRRGWQLHNHPERLAFSATPADFGALAIQRRRWACGGLILLPKLMRHLGVSFAGRGRSRRAALIEGFLRAHYLGSLAWVPTAVLVMLFYPFGDAVMTTPWLPLAALPYFLVYARDLRVSDYRGLTDLPKVYALNLALLVVHASGAASSMKQALLGRKVPFRRTPKIDGRTAVEPRFLVAAWGLPGWCAIAFVSDLWLGNLTHAVFVGINGLMFGYAAIAYLGLRASLEDLAAIVGTLRKNRPTALAPT